MKLHLLFIPIILFFTSCARPAGDSETDPADTIVTKNTEPVKEEPDPVKKYNVIGWHRHGSGDVYKNYDYSVLNMMAYFSYKVDPHTGETETTYNWKTSPAIDEAMRNGTKVYLTVANFGYPANNTFFANQEAQSRLIENLASLVKERSAHGICLDFEEVSHENKDKYNDFVKRLAQKLEEDHLKLVVVLPLYYKENVADPAVLSDYVEQFVMMGYACYHKHSTHAGPISPLQSGDLWEKYSLEPNVDGYLSGGFKPEQFMLALPLYGGTWQTETHELNSRAIEGIASPPYAEIRNQFDGPYQLEPISKSAYHFYKKDGKHMQTWFESKESYAIKLDFVKSKNLAGIGLWALGYDNGYNDIWNTIDSVFTAAN